MSQDLDEAARYWGKKTEFLGTGDPRESGNMSQDLDEAARYWGKKTEFLGTGDPRKSKHLPQWHEDHPLNKEKRVVY